MTKSIFALMTAAMIAASYNNYGVYNHRRDKKPSDRVKALYRDNRKLHEFTVCGEKVMAYSKKDAIKRFKYRTGGAE